MDHKYFQDLLSAYLDKELTPELSALMDEHLKVCSECRDQLGRLENLQKLVARHSQLDGEDYWEHSADRIERRLGISQTEVTDLRGRKPKRAAGLGWRISAVAASILILGYIGLHQSDFLRDDVMIAPSDQTIPRTPVASGDTAVIGEESKAVTSASDEGELGETRRAPDNGLRLGPVPKKAEGVTVEEGEKTTAVGQRKEIGARPERVPTPSGSLLQQAISPGHRADIEADVTESVPADKGQGQKMSAAADDDYESKAGIEHRIGSPDVASQLVTPTEDVRVFTGADVSEMVASELAFWRQRRDSLLALAIVPEEGEQTKRGRVALSKISREPEAVPDTGAAQRSVEAGLAEAWYNVCGLSADSLEIESGVVFLERVADAAESPNSKLAQRYLQKLGRRQ